MITEHTICALPEDHDDYPAFAITVAYRGAGTWAVLRRGRYRLGTDGQWRYEPQPSSRDDDWLAAHSFDEATALRLAAQEASRMTCNGFTAADVLARAAR